MRKRVNGLLWAVLAVLWFLFTTVLLFGILSNIVNQDRQEEDRKEETNVRRNLPQTRISTTTKRMIESLLEEKTARAYKFTRYSLDVQKSRRLDAHLRKMLKTHKRPKDSYYSFNVTRSETLSVTRDVIDERPDECKKRMFNYSALPTLSVVTPLHNEALTTLLRHVHAILNRTPPKLLKDIILVDDNSTLSYLGSDFQEYLKILDSKIQIVRNTQREGLILSRLKGEVMTQGDVVVFMDAHMEVCEGWAEPLLERIKSQSAIVVQPDIAAIDGDTFSLYTGFKVKFRGGFGWDTRYSWLPLPTYHSQFRNSEWDPIPVPILQGSCIAVSKSYFHTVGRFDDGLEIWGGEHFELSFNVWMTGGRIETMPCSKVGHIFKSNKYSFGQKKDKNYIVAKNNMRVAEVWMDEYKHIVRAAVKAWQNPLPVFTDADWKSIGERKKMRRRRKSESFNWFLKNVIPEYKIPSKDDSFFGEIQNVQTKSCFFVFDDDYIGMTSKCETFVIIPENSFAFDNSGRLKYGDKCVGYDRRTYLLLITECPCKRGGKDGITWSFTNDQLVLTEKSETLCATQANSGFSIHNGKEIVQLQACDKKRKVQKWSFQFHFLYK
ncbi:polypeptide N-acetylgalactosaminyltransferase 13-like [Haliotis rufescens]|uniref:polypeptide N-acetylgalactosaminyltransferase 13-like n=1 Tax=Haliotis rufescens TaxID=6454 RepID=UPI00201ED062|nr:polypeptide N-acetylgalactosaminyltransferase 13-like [Haliotis rufescens]